MKKQYLLIALMLLLALTGCNKKMFPSEINTQNEKNGITKINMSEKFEYKVTVEDAKKLLSIFDKGTLLQTIEYESLEERTDKDYYFEDVNFDGVEDLLIPAESPDYGMWFYSYKWNEETNQFVEFESIHGITNPVIDYENKQILHHSSDNQKTSYYKWEYNENGEIHYVSMLGWFPAYLERGTSPEDDTSIYVREQVNGNVSIFYIPSNPDFPLEPDKNSDEFKKYTEKGSYWDIDSEKWEDYFFTATQIIPSESADDGEPTYTLFTPIRFEKKDTSLESFFSESGFSVLKESLTDLDGDGNEEKILWLNYGENEYLGSLILRTENETTYAYLLYFREFYELKADGSFLFSGGVSNHGIGKLLFLGDTLEVKKIAFCESKDNNTVFYYIDGKPVSKAEFDSFQEVQAEKPYAIWE